MDRGSPSPRARGRGVRIRGGRGRSKRSQDSPTNDVPCKVSKPTEIRVANGSQNNSLNGLQSKETDIELENTAQAIKMEVLSDVSIPADDLESEDPLIDDEVTTESTEKVKVLDPAVDKDLSIADFFKAMSSQQLLHPDCEMSTPEILKALMNIFSLYGDQAAINVTALIASIAPEIKPLLCVYNLIESQKYFPQKKPPIKVELLGYCSKCLTLLVLQHKSYRCENCKCQRALKKNEIILCLTNDVKEQLKFLLEKAGLAQLLEQWDEEGDERRGGVMRDVRDGLRYRTLPRTSKYDLSLIHGEHHSNGNFLGVGQQNGLIYTNMMSVAEIRPHRFREDFVLISDIWYFPTTTLEHVNKMLEPMQDLFKELGSKGLQWQHPFTKRQHTSKVFLLLSSLQTDVRGDLQKITGCSFCEDAGMSKTKTQEPLFQYKAGNEAPDLRTHCSIMEQAVRDLKMKKDEKTNDEEKERAGVYDISPLAFLPYFNMVDGFSSGSALDVCGSVPIAHHLKFLFNLDKRSTKPPFKAQERDKISELIKQVSLTLSCFFNSSRPSTFEELGLWSFKQQLCWFLFYSLPCLEKVLDIKYLEHYMLFVQGIYNLLDDQVSPDDIQESQRLLEKFVEMAQDLYGEAVMTMEIHGLLHYAKNCQQCGPFWSSTTPLMRTSCQLVEIASKVFLDFSRKNFTLLMSDCYENAQVRFDCNRYLKTPVCMMIGEGQLVSAELNAPKWISETEGSTLFFSKARIQGVVFDVNNPNASLLAYEMDKNKVGYAKVKRFCRDGANKEIMIGQKLHLLEPKFKSKKLDVVVRCFRPFRVAGTEEGLIYIPVEKILKPLFVVGDIVCIPPFKFTSSLLFD